MIRSSLCLLAGLALAAPAAPVRAQAAASSAAPVAAFVDLRAQAPIHGDPRAGAGKAAVCAACHGARGVAIAPNFPNLAGQSATYLYVQLRQYKNGQRRDPIMTGQVAPLDDADLRDLASYFASLAPKPPGQADAASRGAQLFAGGDPARGVPPCQGCHGPAGTGPQPLTLRSPHPPWATYPRLRGQSAPYLAKQLADFASGARGGSSNARIMQDVARNLDEGDIQALSAWLSAL